MSFTGNAVREKETYERMDTLFSALAGNEAAQAVLVSLWRKQVWGFATMEHLRRVESLMPELWRDLVAVTVPNVNILNRWENDHRDHVSR